VNGVSDGDVWSLGILTGYMATKRLPFVQESDKKQLKEIVRCFGTSHKLA